jgi:HEAT repeat protein
MRKRPAVCIAGLLGLALLAAPVGAVEPESEYLGKSMSHWLQRLREVPQDPKKPEAEWSRAPMALAHIGEPAVGGVVLALGAASPLTRLRAATCLLAMRPHPEEASPALLTALKDEESGVRQTAAAALGAGRAASPDIVSGLTEALKDAQPRVRESAVTSLGRLGAVDAVPALEAVAGDPNAAVRAAGLKALARIREAASPAPVDNPR